jgi:hypothetical protein
MTDNNMKPQFNLNPATVYLCAPFQAKDEIKRLGANFDVREKAWFITAPFDSRLAPWMPTMDIQPDLVPMTSHCQNVRSHVTPDVWKQIAKVTYAAFGNRCRACGGRGRQWPVECHEVWSYDDVKKVQRLDGMVALCPQCHEVVHFGLANVNGRSEEALAHMSAVNQMTRSDCVDVVNKAIEVCRARSSFDWQLDLTLLDRCGVEHTPPSGR